MIYIYLDFKKRRKWFEFFFAFMSTFLNRQKLCTIQYLNQENFFHLHSAFFCQQRLKAGTIEMFYEYHILRNKDVCKVYEQYIHQPLSFLIKSKNNTKKTDKTKIVSGGKKLYEELAISAKFET